MGLTIPTEVHKGPWILNQNDLEDLETVLIEIEKYLAQSLEIEIIEFVEAENDTDILLPDEKQKKISDAGERKSLSFHQTEKDLLGNRLEKYLKIHPSIHLTLKNFMYLWNMGIIITSDWKYPAMRREN